MVLFHLKYCLTASGLTDISLQNVHKLMVTSAEAWSTVLRHVRMRLRLNLEANSIWTARYTFLVKQIVLQCDLDV